MTNSEVQAKVAEIRRGLFFEIEALNKFFDAGSDQSLPDASKEKLEKHRRFLLDAEAQCDEIMRDLKEVQESAVETAAAQAQAQVQGRKRTARLRRYELTTQLTLPISTEVEAANSDVAVIIARQRFIHVFQDPVYMDVIEATRRTRWVGLVDCMPPLDMRAERFTVKEVIEGEGDDKC